MSPENSNMHENIAQNWQIALLDYFWSKTGHLLFLINSALPLFCHHLWGDVFGPDAHY